MSRGRGQNRKNTTVAHRRLEVARLYLRGQSQIEIGEKLGISQSTVSADICLARDAWREKAADHIGQTIINQLAKLDEAERQAWLGWERSCEMARKRTKKADGGKETSIEKQAGNPRFIQLVVDIIARRCQLLDAEPVRRVIIMKETGDANQVAADDAATRLAELTAILRKRAGAADGQANNNNN